MKYVIIDLYQPVLFSAAIEHKEMKKLGPVTSAGFVHLDGDIVVCYGDSFSLMMGPGQHDADLIKQLIQGAGIP